VVVSIVVHGYTRTSKRIKKRAAMARGCVSALTARKSIAGDFGKTSHGAFHIASSKPL
jgi:hypothetical protein